MTLYAAVVYGWVSVSGIISPIGLTVAPLNIPQGDSFMFQSKENCENYLVDRLKKFNNPNVVVVGQCTPYELSEKPESLGVVEGDDV